MPGAWSSRVFAIFVLIVVIAVTYNIGEEQEFVRLAQQAQPVWLLVGLLFQTATYLVQALVWRMGLRASGENVSLIRLSVLSLAQLCVNQLVPSASVSGAIYAINALRKMGIPQSASMRSAALSWWGFLAGYSLAIILMLVSLWYQQRLTLEALMIWSLTVVGGGLLLSLLIIRFSSVIKLMPARFAFVRRKGPLSRTIQLIRSIPIGTLPRMLLVQACLLQFSMFVLDSLTLWSMLHAIGFSLNPAVVFCAFIMASLVKTVIIIPGGLGISEAASIGSLNLLGIPVAAGLAATLLFRGLSFWLPMIPGLVCLRRYMGPATKAPKLDSIWKLSLAEAFRAADSTEQGLSSQEAASRLRTYGPNEIETRHKDTVWDLLWNQIKSPLVLLLLFAAVVSAALHDWVDAAIVGSIILIGAGISAWREYGAQTILLSLRSRLEHRVEALRVGAPVSIPASQVVRGDVIILSAGSMVPADGIVVEANNLYVNEASITGESFPVEKYPSSEEQGAGGDTPRKFNCVYLGSYVQSGEGKFLAINTGKLTLYGDIAISLMRKPPTTAFDKGVASFGYLILRVMLVIVIAVFAINAHHLGVTAETLMFSVALAVGLSPELLPLIVNYNLAVTAGQLAHHGVLVRHPKAIENLGSIDVLCSDKTGTLTEGVVQLEGVYNSAGVESDEVLRDAVINARLQSGLANPIDDLLSNVPNVDTAAAEKLAEVPYDFSRKRLSVIVQDGAMTRLIAKGALMSILEVCEFDVEGNRLTEGGREAIAALYEKWGEAGMRVLGVAGATLSAPTQTGADMEKDLRFYGFIVCSDRPKAGIRETLQELHGLGVQVKIVSGDNRIVTKAVARAIGLNTTRLMTGEEMNNVSNEALPAVVEDTDLFAEMYPNQKERLVLALKKRGHAVGYMGDGINDISAVHAADASICVETSVDVLKSAADFILLEKSLDMIKTGIVEGRKTFANSIKYINVTMSSNFGNMISMALATLYIPFLPMLPAQILSNNLLSDVPALGLAKDNVDDFQLKKPAKWDVHFIFQYMVMFGLISSCFDLLLFWFLLHPFHTSVVEFRTAWFVASLLTELTVRMILRTQLPFFKSKPRGLLLWLTVILCVIAVVIPYIPAFGILGFVPLPTPLLITLLAVTVTYMFVTEFFKLTLIRHKGKRGLSEHSEVVG